MKQAVTGSNLEGTVKPPSQTDWGMKRHRTTGIMDRGVLNEGKEKVSKENAGALPPKASTSDLEKRPGTGLLGRRFADVATSVPIKKRKIHVEAIRSPSPPLRSSSSPSCVEAIIGMEAVDANENDKVDDKVDEIYTLEDPLPIFDGGFPKGKGDVEKEEFLFGGKEKVCSVSTELEVATTSLDTPKVTSQTAEDDDQAEVECESATSNEEKNETSVVVGVEAKISPCTNTDDCLEKSSSESNRGEAEHEGGTTNKRGGWIEWSKDELEEAEEHVDYGEEDVLEYDERMPTHQIEDDDEVFERESSQARVMVSEEATEALNSSEKELDAVIIEEANASEEDLMDEEENQSSENELLVVDSSRGKASGWDKLPEGYASVEDALRAAAKENSERRARCAPWGTSASVRRGSVAPSSGRSSRGLSRGMTSPAGRTRSDIMLSAREGYQFRRLEAEASTRFNSRDFGRGRHLGRGVLLGRGGAGGRFDCWINGLASSSSSASASSSHWVPNHRQSSPSHYGGHVGFGSRGPTVEKGGFSVGLNGAISKLGMGQARQGGGSLRPVISSRGGRGMTMSGHRLYNSPSSGAGGAYKGMDTGRIRGGRGIGPSYGRSNSHAILDPYRPGGGRPLLGGSGMNSAIGNSSPRRTYSGGLLFSSRQEQSRRSYSRSRSRSPQWRPSPRSSRGIGIPKNNSQYPHRIPLPHHNTQQQSLLPSPKLMSVLSSRSQKSPPKSFNDRREGYINRDRGFKCSSSSNGAIRTSPHVVHGSSLTDERDQQVLAGARHSSPKCKQIEPRSGSVGKSTETRRAKREEDNIVDDSFRESEMSRNSARDVRRERGRDDEDDRHRESSKFGRDSSRYANGDDDVAPRRRRPS